MRYHKCWQRGCLRLVKPGYRYCHEHWLQHREEHLKAIKKNQENKVKDPLYQAHQKNKAQINATERQKFYNEHKRSKESSAFYNSARWRKTSALICARDNMCSGRTGLVLDDHDFAVDHIVRRDLCDDPFDLSNLWLLSRQDHDRKTRIEEAILKKTNGVNVLKHMTKKRWIQYLNEPLQSRKINRNL